MLVRIDLIGERTPSDASASNRHVEHHAARLLDADPDLMRRHAWAQARINRLVDGIDRSGDVGCWLCLDDKSMTLIDVLYSVAMTAGIAVGGFGVVVLVVGAVMSFFVDASHPALQPAPSVTDIVRVREFNGVERGHRVDGGHGVGGIAVAA